MKTNTINKNKETKKETTTLWKSIRQSELAETISLTIGLLQLSPRQWFSIG